MAQTSWEPDGTQPPSPSTVWNDPLAGLVTGASYEQEPLRVNVVKPVEPDLSEVRRAVDAALAGEDEQQDEPAVPAPRRSPSPAFRGGTPGMVPPNPRAGWPRSPSARQIPGFRLRGPQAAQIRRVRSQRGRTGAGIAGIVGVLILVGLIIVMIVTIISGLMETISSIVN